jgi:hypothetical protein
MALSPQLSSLVSSGFSLISLPVHLFAGSCVRDLGVSGSAIWHSPQRCEFKRGS